MIDTAPGFISPWFRPDWVPPLYLSDSVGWGYNMSSISCARTSCIDLKANRIHLDAPSRPSVFGTSFSCLPSLLERLHLQPALSPPLSPKNLNYLPPRRQASPEHNRTT